MSDPLMSAEQANQLLDSVIFDRVISFIDLDALFRLEQELWAALEEAGAAEEQVPQLAKEIVDRALKRVCDERRRDVAFNPFVHDDCARVEADQRREQRRTRAGYSLSPVLGFPCDLCEDEREDRVKRRRSS